MIHAVDKTAAWYPSVLRQCGDGVSRRRWRSHPTLLRERSGRTMASGTDLGGIQKQLVCFTQPWVAQQEKCGVLVIQRVWLPNQMHPHFLGQPVALASVTGAAAGDQILPGALPPTRARQYVVKRQLAEMLATVLTRVLVAQQDVGAGWTQHHPRYPHIRQQL